MKKLFTILTAFVLMVCMAGTTVSAAKTKEVHFSPQDSCVFGVTKKGNMILEMNIGKYAWGKDGKQIERGRFIWKVSGDCHFKYCSIGRSNGKKSYQKISYKEFKENVDSFRENTGTMATCWVGLTIRNGKVTGAVFYCML